MIISNSIYRGDGIILLATYTHHQDVYRARPDESFEPIAHITYAMKGGKRGIDVFLPEDQTTEGLQRRLKSLKRIMAPAKRTIHITQEDLRNQSLNEIDPKHNVNYEIIRQLRGTPIEKELICGTRIDIRDFCRKPPKKTGNTAIIYPEKITPPPLEDQIKRRKVSYLLEGGKQEGTPSCLLTANLDFTGSCPSAWIHDPSDPEGVYRLDARGDCLYCYAGYQHLSFPKTINDFTKEQLRSELNGNCYLKGRKGPKHGKPIKVLRLGKTTEAGSVFTLDLLAPTLETCLETGTRIVMPTKYLKFYPEIADLVRRTNSKVLFDRGWDELEKGACSHDCDDEFRQEQAIRYKEARANPLYYLLLDAVLPPTERETGILKSAEDYGIPTQLLPINLIDHYVALEITGIPWENLKGPRRIEEILDIGVTGTLSTRVREIGGYEFYQNKLRARHIHPFWLGLIGDNKGDIRMCHHNKKTTYCGACFLRDGSIRRTVHRKPRRSRKSGFRKRDREFRKKRATKNQLTLKL